MCLCLCVESMATQEKTHSTPIPGHAQARDAPVFGLMGTLTQRVMSAREQAKPYPLHVKDVWACEA